MIQIDFFQVLLEEFQQALQRPNILLLNGFSSLAPQTLRQNWDPTHCNLEVLIVLKILY